MPVGVQDQLAESAQGDHQGWAGFNGTRGLHDFGVVPEEYFDFEVALVLPLAVAEPQYGVSG